MSESTSPMRDGFRLRSGFVAVCGVVGIANLVVLGISALARGSLVLFVSDLGASAVLVGLLIWLRLSGDDVAVGRAMTALSGPYFLYLLVTGGVDGAGYLWMYALPLATHFALGARGGAIASGAALALAVLYFFVRPRLPADWSWAAVYGTTLAVRFTASYMLVTLMAHTLERMRAAHESDLQGRNKALLEALAETRTHDQSLEAAYSELREAKERADRADRTRAEFLAGMGHELRTPLSHILGFSQLVATEAGATLSPKHREYLDHVQGSARMLGEIIDELLELSRLEGRQGAPRRTDVSLPELAADCVAMLGQMGRDRGIRPTVDFDGAPQTIRSDLAILRRILLCLMSFSVARSGGGDSVVVRAESVDQARVLFSVQDDGVGIAANELPGLFSRGAVRDRILPSGVERSPGLTLCRRLVEICGGRVWATSEGGKGCTLNAELPAG